MPPIFASLGAGSIRSYGLTAFKRVQALVATFFNSTSLLLNTSSTNGAQNNTILDSSGSNFTITRNGDLTQGTFTPFSQPPGYWSNYFDGTDDFYTSSTALFNYTIGNASTQTATIEALIYITGFQSAPTNIWENPCIAGKGDVYMNFGVNMSGNLFLYHISGGTPRDTVSSSTIPLNTWTHVAVVISSGTVTLYINGVASGSGTWFGIDSAGQNSTSYFGETPDTDSRAWLGYISNLRVSTTARAITIPTSPYINDGSTAFLTFQSNRVIDNSSNAYTLSVSGTPTVEAFSPFVPTDEYSIAAVGGSAYFDGTGDALSFQDTTQSGTSSDFNIGASNNASVDYWFYLQKTGYSAAFSKQVFSPTDWNGQIWYQNNLNDDSGNISAFWRGGNNYNYYAVAAPSAYLNQWNHFVFASDTSDNLSVFLNGTRILTTVTTIGLATATNYITWGQQAASLASGNFKGYMSGLRFIQGSGAFNAASSSITVPTAPPTNTATTKLLLNSTNAGIFDATGKNDIETVGNAQVSTTQAKFGTTSMYFDGTGDNLKLKLTNAIGSGDYTIEGFFYVTASGTQYLFDIRESSQTLGAYVVGSSTTLSTWVRITEIGMFLYIMVVVAM